MFSNPLRRLGYGKISEGPKADNSSETINKTPPRDEEKKVTKAALSALEKATLKALQVSLLNPEKTYVTYGTIAA